VRILIGVELDYENVGALMRLRNYLKPRSRILYLLVRSVLTEHFKQKHNGRYYSIYFHIPPLWFYWAATTISYRIRRILTWIRKRRGWYMCWECYGLYPPDPFYRKEGFCPTCYHDLMSEYLEQAIRKAKP
jgi:hypothetical protein